MYGESGYERPDPGKGCAMFLLGLTASVLVVVAVVFALHVWGGA